MQICMQACMHACVCVLGFALFVGFCYVGVQGVSQLFKTEIKAELDGLIPATLSAFLRYYLFT